MQSDRDIMQQALGYMESVGQMDMYPEEWAIAVALRERLAQPEQPAKIDIDYWVSSRSQIIEALAKAGFTLMSNSNGFWLQPAQEPEQEPVAWRTFDGEGNYDFRDYDMNENYDKEWAERNPTYAHWVEPLYTNPPQRTWVGLTDEERNNLWREVVGWGDPSHDDEDLMKAIEAKLKEKNNG